MDIETLALELQKTADRAERNTGRIKKLEEEHEAIHQLATSVAVMAEKMDAMNKSLTSMNAKVEDIENRPAKRWDSLVSAIIGAAAGAFLCWAASGMPGVN